MSVQISARQQRVHVVSEAAAVLLVVPFLGLVAAQKELPTWMRIGVGALAVTTLALDGYLLIQWMKR